MYQKSFKISLNNFQKYVCKIQQILNPPRVKLSRAWAWAIIRLGYLPISVYEIHCGRRFTPI